jgi:hypothetical protein
MLAKYNAKKRARRGWTPASRTEYRRAKRAAVIAKRAAMSAMIALPTIVGIAAIL